MGKSLIVAAAAAFVLTTTPASASECVSLTVVRPAADAANLLRNPMARTVLRGEGLDLAAIGACNAGLRQFRVSADWTDFVVFAAYRSGKGATFKVPKTGTEILAYSSRCEGEKHRFSEAVVTLDGDKTVELESKDAGDEPCN